MSHATNADRTERAVRTRRPPGWRDILLAVLVLVILAMCAVYVMGRQSVDESTQKNYEQSLIIEKQEALLSQTCLPGQPLAATYNRQPVNVQVSEDGRERTVTLYTCVANADLPPRPPSTPDR